MQPYYMGSTWDSQEKTKI